MRGGKKELWEDLFVVWQDFGFKCWMVTRVAIHHASDDRFAQKRVAGSELVASARRDDTVIAGSKQEALLKHMILSGCAENIWSVVDGPVYSSQYGKSYGLAREI